ncbi:uncharacterized protein BX664DRAFT_369927 [Halteromyces radiatus]|uniref:uncharacterized protein n=1 Tax=Halteromyces radiatus TaxID=101107 RepID=UPI00221FFE73|nr:uncharacterized protein BX664DRAFT_369927 [Halteromyces radiatus]KAI8096212.1 hypothetical protein BX664DRAFT_369927 [Halteromyces radiatus]
MTLLFYFNDIPATCELCGHWMPHHESNCPRNGVHPSQWGPSSYLLMKTDDYHLDCTTCFDQ